MQQQPPPFWRFPPFSALLADSFVENTELEDGNIVLSAKILEVTFSKIAKEVSEKGPSESLGLFTTDHLRIALKGLELVHQCEEIAEAALKAEKPEDALKVVQVWIDKVDKLEPGNMLFGPGGWEGLLSKGTVIYIVQRISPQTYSLIVCNTGQGLEYHPSTGSDTNATPPKIKYKPYLRLDGIPASRMTDVAFWSTAFTLWMKQPPSEYHRHEVIYDVLLPWLAEGVPLQTGGVNTVSYSLISTQNDPHAVWKTPQRAGTSSFKSLLAALQYAYRSMGLSTPQLKQLFFALRKFFVKWAAEDLVARYGRRYPSAAAAIQEAARIGINPAPEQNPEEKPPVLSQTDLKLISMGCGQLALTAIKENDAGRLDAEGIRRIKQLIDAVHNVANTVRADAVPGGLPPRLQAEMNARLQPFYDSHLLQLKSVEDYAGAAAEAKMPQLADLLTLPIKVDNFAQAAAAIIQCDNIAEEILARTVDSSASSRLVLQMEIISLIGSLFCEILPLPCPLDASPDSDRFRACIWKGGKDPIVKEVQMACLERIHKLALKYASVWQAIERPTREYDAERCLVASCMLVIFDAVIRSIAVGEPLIISELLWEDGGYCISTGVCTNNRPFEEITATMELINPAWTKTKNDVLEYLRSMKKVCRNAIFELRQPDKVEFKKYGATVSFLKTMMMRCGYELIRRDNPNPPPEIEALMDWMCNDRSPLAQDHPEFSWLRDMAALFKFLSTMESRETEQLRRRKAVNEFQYWRLTTDEEGGRRGWWGKTAAVDNLTWEAVNFRGQDLNTADVVITGFGDRELIFGEGPVVHSPADVSKMLTLPMPTEDDILHADKLPNFGDTLSREEAEALLSYLTVDYVRIPLVVGFFASNDRMTYLFNQQLRDLLRAVLFESGPWVPMSEQTTIQEIPVRRTALQQKQHIEDRFLLANIPEDVKVLGAPHGLLLNELRNSPAATMEPLLKIFNSIADLRDASVHSSDATFILYLIQMAVDVESYLVYTVDEASKQLQQTSAPQNIQATINIAEATEHVQKLQYFHKQLKEFLHGLSATILRRWLKECEEQEDIQTAAMVHAFLALLWTSLKPNELTAANVEALLGSLAFVRNWHGFGLGHNRSDIIWESGASGFDPEVRLLRFLQAQGIDTSRIGKAQLEQFIKEGQSRPLFLHLGRKTIRAPRLVKVKESGSTGEGIDIEKLPPADVPESRLFFLLQKHRRPLVAWLEAAPAKVVDGVLENIIRVALRSSKFEYTGWQKLGHGRFLAEQAEIKFDAQAAEIFWRNNELKPVPDSMTRFTDFEALFGGRAFYCGLVLRSQHRHWVHIVGTEYDLQEWDKPKPSDQGVGAPKEAPSEDTTSNASQFCMRCGQLNSCFVCETCTVVNCGVGTKPGTLCQVCGTPKGGVQEVFPSHRGEPKVEPVKADRVIYNGVLYDRPFDPYSEDPHPHKTELWAVEILLNVLLTEYPPMPPDGKMSYKLLFPQEIAPEDATKIRLIGCDAADKPEATWKEVVILKHRKMLLAFNLISHGRRVFRQLIYSTDARYSFHNLSLKPKGPYRYACGDFKKKRNHDDSLVITRQSVLLGGKEIFIPPRLLQGAVPSALLEAFHMWHGEDGIIRGTPIETGSQWFNYNLEITLKTFDPQWKGEANVAAIIVRRPIHVSQTKIKATGKTEKSALLRDSSLRITEIDDKDKMFTESAIMELSTLGYPPAACRLALKRCENNVDMAASWLLDENNLPDIMASAMMETDNMIPGFSVVDERQGYLPLLESEGYSRAAAQYALNLMGGDLALVKAWLSDDANKDQIAMLDEMEAMDIESEAAAEGERKAITGSGGLRKSVPLMPVAVDEHAADLILLNLLEVTETQGPNSILYRLAAILSRLEDLSHVLAWVSTHQTSLDASGSLSKSGSLRDPDIGRIIVLELPRLKVKFQPRKDDDGNVRLYLLDHEGWFVSDSVALFDSSGNAMEEDSPKWPSGTGFLRDLMHGIENCLVLENQSKELQLMVANHDVTRVRIRGHPFASALIFDRSSMGWQQVMDSRFYLFPVHTSRTFLLPQTLGATLYLLLLRFFHRDYSAAFKLAEACHLDTTFTAEEQWIFDQIERAKDDMHPDAHACRLKLTLALMYSENRIKWENHVEMDRYLAKLPHVSSDCRLTPEEELEVLYQCKQGTPRIKNRLEYLKVALPFMKGESTQDKVIIKIDQPRVAGQPWMKLCSYSKEYLDSYATHITRLHYRPPVDAQALIPMVADKKCFDVLWDSLVVADEESGSNRQLGFLFLYEVLRGRLFLTLGGKDCTKSFGEILTRFFHLKHVRWGRERVEEGEQEVTVSMQMAELASVMYFPQYSWPALPQDNQSKILLKDGVNIYSATGRGTELKTFLELLDNEFKQFLTTGTFATQMQLLNDVNQTLRQHPLGESNQVSVAPAIQIWSWQKRLAASNTGCEFRILQQLQQEAPQFTIPLSPIGLDQFVEWRVSSEKALDGLPFEVDKHPASKTVVAQDMLRRIAEDVQGYKNSVLAEKVPVLIGLAPELIKQFVDDPLTPGLDKAIKILDSLVELLLQCQYRDGEIVEKLITQLLERANHVSLPNESTSLQQEDLHRYRFLLRRTSGQLAKADMSFLTSILLSSKALEDLHTANPFVENAEQILEATPEILLRSSRISHANRAIANARDLKHLLLQLHPTRITNQLATTNRLQHAAAALVENLTSKRHFLKRVQNSNLYGFDPRLLVFEYIFNILLRRRQIEMIESFVDSMKRGDSRVQQMIMGAGKTTVVGPLLCLILANGDSLVMQVMPTALLEQTRNILRRCFSVIIVKHIYTLEFNRSVEDSVEFVAKLYAKLNNARTQRGIVCAAPECVKSLMLKFVEQLHSIEQLDMTLLVPGQSRRSNREITRLRDQMLAKSDMGDALVNILDLWQKGVLIMDEVDVLLHPLKSELNFPIGHKQPIDLSGHRWELPIHILDAIFFRDRNSVSDDLTPYYESAKRVGQTCESLLLELKEVLNEGFDIHAMQRIPHLVLLNPAFYHSKIQPVISKWTLLWLYKYFVGAVNVDTSVLLDYIQGVDIEKHRNAVENGLLPESKKLLNLAQSWITSLLPHVLSKIDRVSFGLLSPADIAIADPRTPKSRLLMAVPFVGKDVPSQSSEFAHPDALIGLTVLAYRYEGLRASDLKRVIQQLKQDYSRQVGPRDQRPASVTFQSWLDLAKKENLPGANSILPLSLFQPSNPKQLAQLYSLVRYIPQVVHYYLRQHIFPACMNFQKLKVSASGHELGSKLLFSRRIGFSGTPSNLLPIDLGECQYEPGSDGKILNVLSSPNVVTASLKEKWTAQSLLRDICAADPPFHALIDTGALITGMDNEEVAHFMLKYLPEWMEGVVYLDKQDRQMILLRGTGRSMLLAQCGISTDRRFTFYDQIHTTGMDIKQAPNARAVITIGKDMTFRDYAQGSYRMRGIGKGQTVHLFIIPEVQNRINEELGERRSGRPELDVPAWLLINSMRSESLQFVKMSTQELHNIWRKKALNSLVLEVHTRAFISKESGMQRLRRFEDLNEQEQKWLRGCVNQFRELISYVVPDRVPTDESFVDKLKLLAAENSAFSTEQDDLNRVHVVISKVSQVSEFTTHDEKSTQYNAEVVHEQEQEAEEEAEEEAEQEEQKVSAFTRDDEQHNPWSINVLTVEPTGKVEDSAFYKFRDFHVREEQPKLTFPEGLMLTDNFFKPRWVGVGDRRLKNINLMIEWIPEAWKLWMEKRMPILFEQLTKGCGNSSCTNLNCASNPNAAKLDANTAAAKALDLVTKTIGASTTTLAQVFCSPFLKKLEQQQIVAKGRYLVAVSLAEGETIRRMIHMKQSVLNFAALALRSSDGRIIDHSKNFFEEASTIRKSATETAPGLISMGVQCFRFFNCEMFYSDGELDVLEYALRGSSLDNRREFFLECLRLRRRERNMWADTPLAKIFLPREEWHLLRTRAILEQVNEALQKAINERRHDIYALFDKFDEDGDGHLDYQEMQKFFEWLQLGFSPKDYYEVIRFADKDNKGKISKETYQAVFELPSPQEVQERLRVAEERRQLKNALKQTATRWRCNNCTFINSINDTTCVMCELGWSGRKECPKDKWVCAGEKGGCTFFNPKTQFYCEVCNRARPDLANVRL